MYSRGVRSQSYGSVLPEDHLWGPRDYFKSEFYKSTRASFVSEIGYHGCPSAESIKKFISQDKNLPKIGNTEWDFHASNPFMPDNKFLNYRTQLMIKQIREVFGTVPEKLEDFVEASQICQAEAKKFFIELVRSNPKFSGVLWWNLIDCWPQFSDAVTDYYFNKKRSYNYIKRLQEPFAGIITEAKDGNQKVMGCNDSAEKTSGSYRIFDAEEGNEISAGNFSLQAGELKELDLLADFSATQKLFMIEWELDSGRKGRNHYLCGKPPFDFERVRKILP
jgi:beta-mannosidase